MKKTFKSLASASILTFVLGAMFGCAEKIDQPSVNEQEGVTKTYSMTFNGGVVGYVQADTKATADVLTTWEDGDKIYITFYNGTTKVPGDAVYSEDNGWSVNVDGDLAVGTNLECEVRYFTDPTFTSQYLVSLDSGTGVYESTTGLYDYDGKSLTVIASLIPKVGRIRFTGTPGQEVIVTGLTVFSTFSPSTNVKIEALAKDLKVFFIYVYFI